MSNEQLLGIIKQARQQAQAEAEKPLVDCPVCAHRLDSNGKQLNCPFGHGRWPEGTTVG